jgi:hypothetical protein
MTPFRTYFDIGREHILDIADGYDHILFVVALAVLYQLRDWKKVLILVTAFTIAHSITLALSTLNIIKVNTDLVEFLIVVTIFITAVSNLFKNEENIEGRSMQLNYFYAGFFGLVHGLGFSTLLKTLLGRDKNIVSQLFAFNIGLEFGQIIVVVILLVSGFIVTDLLGVSRRDWKMVISSAIAGMAVLMIKDKIFW